MRLRQPEERYLQDILSKWCPHLWKIFGSLARGSIIMMCRLPRLHRHSHSTQPQYLGRRHPLRHHIQKYCVCLGQSAGPLSPGLSGFSTSKRGVSVEEKHHTRATIAALKHEKSPFYFLTGFPLLIAGSPCCINKQWGLVCTGSQQRWLWRWAGLQAAMELRLRWHTLNSTQTLWQSIEPSPTF